MSTTQHGENLFENAQQARARLQEYGFYPLVRLGNAEHFVRGTRRVIVVYDGELPGDVPLDSAMGVWFVAVGNYVVCDFE